MNKDNILNTLRRNKVRLLLILLALAFAYWVWPTVWRYDTYGPTPVRTNRFTDSVEALDTNQGWVRINK